MSVLRGRGSGEGVVLGRSAVLREDGGRPTLDPELLARLGQNRRRGHEPLDIILIAEDAARALFLPLPAGLNLAGVIAEQDALAATLMDSQVPVVCGIPGARETIEEGVLVLLDAERGRVLLDPSASDIARIQSGPPRPRFQLGAAHLPALTQNGRLVEVWTFAEAIIEVEAARDSGADGLLVLPGGDLLPPFEDSTEATLARLTQLTDILGNGDLALAADPNALELTVLCRLATRCRLRWAVSPNTVPLPARDLREELIQLSREAMDSDQFATAPQLALLDTATSLTGRADELAEWDQLFVSPEQITGLSPLDTLSLPPLFVLLLQGLDRLGEVVAAGVTGVVVPIADVEDAKLAVRQQD